MEKGGYLIFVFVFFLGNKIKHMDEKCLNEIRTSSNSRIFTPQRNGSCIYGMITKRT